ncbi:MAG: DUF4065 domain-containing protein [Candidatus Marinimicrobia bacterium]|nr:DUF4065 domain-containing protein [Candidatus Neomarinimicrobiota bacterium]
MIDKNGRNSYDLYKIVKIIYEADLYHIENHIRSVTGDCVFAMDNGLVPSNTYDLLKNEDDKDPFYRRDNNKRKIIANRKPNLYYLSNSDIKALDHAYKLISTQPFSEIRKKHHENPAWKKHYQKKSSERVPFEELITDEEIKEEVKEYSCGIMI